MKCPKCGSEDCFDVEAIILESETQYWGGDDGCLDAKGHECETHWYSSAKCDACNYSGGVGEFGLTNTYTVFCTREDDVLGTWISYVDAKGKDGPNVAKPKGHPEGS